MKLMLNASFAGVDTEGNEVYVIVTKFTDHIVVYTVPLHFT